MNDELIRAALRPLRDLSAPPLPALRAPAPARPAFSFVPIAAAAALLVALVPLFISKPAETAAPATRLDAAEARVPDVHNAELEALLRREIELLRAELKVAQAR